MSARDVEVHVPIVLKPERSLKSCGPWRDVSYRKRIGSRIRAGRHHLEYGSWIGDCGVSKVAAGGIICLTGVGAGGVGSRAVADVAAAVVLKNNVLVGSVNANKRHWYKAAQAPANADRQWLSRLINRREQPENFKQALERKPDDVKVVIQFSDV